MCLFPLFFLVLLCDVSSAIRDQRSLWLRFDWLATRCVDHLYYLSTIQRFTFIAFGLSNNSESSHKIENCTLSWNYQPFGNQESWRIQAYYYLTSNEFNYLAIWNQKRNYTTSVFALIKAKVDQPSFYVMWKFTSA